MSGVEWAEEEEVFPGLAFSTLAQLLVRIKVRAVGAKVACAGV